MAIYYCETALRISLSKAKLGYAQWVSSSIDRADTFSVRHYRAINVRQHLIFNIFRFNTPKNAVVGRRFST